MLPWPQVWGAVAGHCQWKPRKMGAPGNLPESQSCSSFRPGCYAKLTNALSETCFPNTQNLLKILDSSLSAPSLLFMVTLNCITLGEKMDSFFSGQQTTYNMHLWSPRWQGMSFQSHLKERSVNRSPATTLEQLFKLSLALKLFWPSVVNGPSKLLFELCTHKKGTDGWKGSDWPLEKLFRTI